MNKQAMEQRKKDYGRHVMLPGLRGLVALFVFASCSLHAQTISIDGNRWYEVEITVFSNPQIASAFPEIPRPDKTTLAYPRQLTMLKSPLQALAYDFEGPEEQEEAPLILPDDFRNPEVRPTAPPAPEALLPRPQVSTGQDRFRLPDFERDAFVSLDSRTSTFSRHLQRLRGAVDHHVLFHAVWRQPVLNASQASAIAIAGGEQFAGHHELEGSVTISYNVNRVDIAANLWRNTFATALSAEELAAQNLAAQELAARARSNRNVSATEFSSRDFSVMAPPEEAPSTEIPTWEVPLSPIPTDEPAPEAEEPAPQTFGRNTRNRSNSRGLFSSFLAPEPPRQDIIRVDHMQETRSMVSNTLHYLDHPAFGLLVEVRPYELPVPEGAEEAFGE